MIVARPGWDQVTAVKLDQLYELKSALVLQPGPALFLEGAEQLARIVQAAAMGERLSPRRSGELRMAGTD
jgi:iron complex transport system substrate-binding protein